MSEFLENGYIKPLMRGHALSAPISTSLVVHPPSSLGTPRVGKHIRVDRISLPNGEYYKSGGGYMFYMNTKDGNYTGYAVVTNDGIRGSWGDSDCCLVSNGILLNESVYQIMCGRIDEIRAEKIDEILEK
jgi:hypothetical protein